jgi:hypothetical protein
MDAIRWARVRLSAKFVVSAVVAYAAAATVAAAAIMFLLGSPSLAVPPQVVIAVGAFAWPFVLVAKLCMYAWQLDGPIAHAMAGVAVGLLAGLLILRSEALIDLSLLAAVGMVASLCYFVVRTLCRRVQR